ncbi:MAG TPA: protease inhibitor I42 family protein [Xanthobacteraceae bacterium]|jgi:inhibitor of cysteine peptidase|nr:protease inhibitor I42 family protein [Xanthobacteraceae bacterium]
MREITKADSGREFAVGVGDTFELRLPENPTTGYRWEPCSTTGPTLELAECSFAVSSEALGAGGVRRWIFRAALAGVVRLEFEQRRSWQRQAVDRFDVTVRVQSG